MKLLQRRKENWDNDFVPNILLLPYEIDTGTLCLLAIANIANKTCPFSTVVGMNTYIYNKTVQKCHVNNISGTPELDINYSMGG